MAKKIINGEDVLQALLRGINHIAIPVASSLGPSGRNSVYERVGSNQPISTRDGVTICNQIEADDPFENIAVELVKGVAREAVDQSGDGTTTSVILARAIFAEGAKAITVGANPVALKRGIEKATTAVVKSLKEMAQPISGDMLKQVATISANNDEFLGSLIAQAMDRAGEDGVVTVEISRSAESSLHIVDGMQLGSGYIVPEFVNDRERNECVLEDVAILLWEKKLTTIKPFEAQLKELAGSGKSLLVIAEDVADEALAILAANSQVRSPDGKQVFKFCAIRTPGGVEHLQDIGALTEGKVFTELLGVKLKDVGLTNLGYAKKVIVKQQTTTIIAETRENRSLDRRVNELRTQVAEASEDGSRLRLQSRLARLVGGIAVIRVGAKSELEMSERKDRLEDAMHATRCAKLEGVVPGGGIALLRASKTLEYTGDLDEKHGMQIVERACRAPLETLAANSGKSAEYILEKVFTDGVGWNARTDTFGDMIEMGVIDPLRVVRVALESAASVAALMLITHTLVSNGRS